MANHPNRNQREETLPAVATGTDLDTFRGLEEDAGLGVDELRAEDLTPPFVFIMEKGSPYLDRAQTDKFVPGGKAGDFFDKLTKVYFDGDEGLDILICHAVCEYNEWTPRKDEAGRPINVDGPGFHGTHPRDEDLVRRLIAEQWPSGRVFGPIRMPNGNQLIQTWSVYALWALKPITEDTARRGVFTFTSTRIRPFTDTAAAIRAFGYPGRDEHGRPKRINPASFAHRWHITTVSKSAGGNSWYIPHFELSNGPNWRDSLVRADEPLYGMAREFRELVVSGAARADYSQVDEEMTASSTTVDDEVPF